MKSTQVSQSLCRGLKTRSTRQLATNIGPRTMAWRWGTAGHIHASIHNKGAITDPCSMLPEFCMFVKCSIAT
eukprot:132493-Amphidinium_carterae.2